MRAFRRQSGSALVYAVPELSCGRQEFGPLPEKTCTAVATRLFGTVDSAVPTEGAVVAPRPLRGGVCLRTQAAPDHVVLNGVVFDDLRLVYVPVPKAASTSILSALSEVAGLSWEARMRSRKPEATRGQTVHDGSLWDSGNRLKEKTASERDWILGSDEWFRCTVVREPARRVWSAWVSKVLVRDPRFVLMFGEDWFPAVPSSATDVVEAFRSFVSGLPDRPEWDDSHWSAQAVLAGISTIDYDHVGHLESLERTHAALGRYIGQRGGTLPAFAAENRSLLPFSPGLFDRAAHDACMRLTAPDRRAFGYEPLQFTGGELDGQWLAAVGASIPALQALVERHERLLDLWRMQAEDDQEPGRHARALFTGGIAAVASAATVLAATRRTGTSSLACEHPEPLGTVSSGSVDAGPYGADLVPDRPDLTGPSQPRTARNCAVCLGCPRSVVLTTRRSQVQPRPPLSLPW